MSFILFIIIVLTPTNSYGMALNFGDDKNPWQVYLQSDCYDIWVTKTNLSEQVIDYYKNSNEMKCYKEVGDCENDEK